MEPEERENHSSTKKNEGPQDSTQEATQYNSSIDQEMENNAAIVNSDDRRGDSEAEHFWKFLYASASAVHALNLYRISSELQAERLSLIEGYRELVRLDSSLIPIESSCFQEDDEIVGSLWV